MHGRRRCCTQAVSFRVSASTREVQEHGQKYCRQVSAETVKWIVQVHSAACLCLLAVTSQYSRPTDGVRFVMLFLVQYRFLVCHMMLD